MGSSVGRTVCLFLELPCWKLEAALRDSIGFTSCASARFVGTARRSREKLEVWGNKEGEALCYGLVLKLSRLGRVVLTF